MARLNRLLQDHLEHDKSMQAKCNSAREKLARLQDSVRAQAEETERRLQERLAGLQTEADAMRTDRDTIRGELTVEMEKCRNFSVAQRAAETEKAKALLQAENLKASKELMHKTMAGQVMSIKQRLDEALDTRRNLEEKVKRLSEALAALQDKYKRVRTEAASGKKL